MPRRPYDFYETPPHYLAALLDTIGPLPRHGSTTRHAAVYDCCSGERAIVSPLRALGVACLTNDLDLARPAARHHDAAENGAAWGYLGIPWVITNPPFSQWTRIMRHALRWHRNVAMLARLSILEPTLTSRRQFWLTRGDLDFEIVVLPRYSFRPNDAGKRATDAVTCCWVIRRQTPASRRVIISPHDVGDVPLPHHVQPAMARAATEA